MFSKEIVRSDAFLDMPVSTQLLYFQLGMEADDDGFIDNGKAVSRLAGTSDDDTKLLIAKRFLLALKDGILVVKHWKINNYIPNDRYKETKYVELKNSLLLKENRSYTDCIQNVDKLDTQNRIDKNRLDKNTTAPPTVSPFVWEEYLKGMDNNKRVDIQLIGYFFRRRRLSFSSKEEAESAIKRHLRAAKLLTPFDKKKVFKGMDECDVLERQKGVRWSLETVYKMVTK